jgi:DNA helicase-2/ATP-dependent DNA helicase PcrA
LSSLQKSFLKKLARPNAKFWYIGDGDQSIYAFRGAHGGMMRQLQKECDDTHVLSVNYRSASSIVLHANNVISVNPDRFDIEWKAHRTDEGEVQVDHFDTAADELEAARTWLEASPKTRAVLARTQAVMLPLRELQLPAYTVHESKGLEWPEVWVMGCEASLFPHPLGIKEEERRLFYVAMTRARDMLKMTYCASRSQKRGDSSRKPSGFLFEAQHLQG